MLFYHSKYGKIKKSGVEIMKKSDNGNKLSIILVLCGVALNKVNPMSRTQAYFFNRISCQC